MRKISLEGYLCPKSLGFKQILRTMKITLFLLLATTFSAFSVNVHSQNAKVSFDTHTMKVAQLISTIETQTNYLFVYNKKNVDLNRKVTVKARNKAVSEILDEVFAGTGISYVMEGKNIVLTKESNIAREEVKRTVRKQRKGAGYCMRCCLLSLPAFNRSWVSWGLKMWILTWVRP